MMDETETEVAALTRLLLVGLTDVYAVVETELLRLEPNGVRREAMKRFYEPFERARGLVESLLGVATSDFLRSGVKWTKDADATLTELSEKLELFLAKATDAFEKIGETVGEIRAAHLDEDEDEDADDGDDYALSKRLIETFNDNGKKVIRDSFARLKESRSSQDLCEFRRDFAETTKSFNRIIEIHLRLLEAHDAEAEDSAHGRDAAAEAVRARCHVSALLERFGRQLKDEGPASKRPAVEE